MKKAAALVCSLFLWSSSATALPRGEELAAYTDAGNKLTTLIEGAQGKGAASLKTDEVMGLVRAISDEERTLGAGPIPVSDIPIILEICQAAAKASMALMLFDLKSQIEPGSSEQPIQAERMLQLRSNALAFQDELKELQPFLFRCLASQMQPLTEFALSMKPEQFTQERREGLAQMRSGLLSVYAGGFQLATANEFRQDFRVALLAALAEASGSFASATELPDRRQIQHSAVAAAAKAEAPYRDHLLRISDAFSGEACDGLCTLH